MAELPAKWADYAWIDAAWFRDADAARDVLAEILAERAASLVGREPLPERQLPVRLPRCRRWRRRRRAAGRQRDAGLARVVTGTLGVFVVVLDHAACLAYRPGQYVSLGVEHGGELVQRPYSIVSLERAGTRVELFIRRLPDGRLFEPAVAAAERARVRRGPGQGGCSRWIVGTRERGSWSAPVPGWRRCWRCSPTAPCGAMPRPTS